MTDNNSEIIKYMDDLMQSDLYIKQKKLQEERAKTIKHGKDVVHISYLGGFLNGEDLANYEEDLKKANLQISSYNKAGIIYNSIEDYSNLINVAVNSDLTKNIIFGVAGNLVWDTIKIITKKIFNKTKNKKIDHHTASKKTKKELTFGISLSLNKNTGFNFRLNGKIKAKDIDKVLDKASEFVREQKENKDYKHPLFLYYDDKNDKWVAVDMLDDIKHKMGQNAKPKKKRVQKSASKKIKPKKKNNGLLQIVTFNI
jgi:hypothetical protein